MASVFRASNSKYYTASIKVWNAAIGDWKHVQKATGVTDKAAAMGIASLLEQASGAAKAGFMTRAKAQELVGDIVKMAGCDDLTPVPSLEECALDLIKGVDVAPVTLRKYTAQWEGLKSWAGKRADNPITSFTVADMQSFYTLTRARLSGTTSTDHLNFASMVFKRAITHGHCASNPALGVKKTVTGMVEKLTFSRTEHAAILRAARRHPRKRHWQALASLGWHTGHRIQDLLDVTKKDVDDDLLTIRPRKKRRRGGRTIILPLPRWLAKMVVRLEDFKEFYDAGNRNGHISNRFVKILVNAGIDPMPVHRGKRAVNLKSFHSYRHSMQTRLTSAGVTDEISRLVTDHESTKVARTYRHAEIEALRKALALARRR